MKQNYSNNVQDNEDNENNNKIKHWQRQGDDYRSFKRPTTKKRSLRDHRK